jgi:hypothetical protein
MHSIHARELIRYKEKFDDPKLPGEMITTTILKSVSCGTKNREEGISAGIPAEACYLGCGQRRRPS